MASEDIPPSVCELSILLTSDTEIQKLNGYYRNKDKATDVLSFSQLEGEPGALPYQLGDVIISLETAKVQAKKFGLSIEQEFLRLLIHGILHLFGYDHVGVSASAATRMRRLEEKLFAQYVEEAEQFCIAAAKSSVTQ